MAQSSYQQLNLNSDIVLSWSFSFQQPPVIADINNISTSQIQMSCYGATTGNLVAIYNNGSSGVGATLTNNSTLAAFTVDGLSPTLNARILVKNQTPLSNPNGIYTLTTIGDGSTPWILTRAIDYDTTSEIQKGDFVQVTNGTVNANTKWIQTANIISVGISSPNFTMRNNGWTITLPDATLATPGQNFQFNNTGLFPFQILANDGITNIANVSSGDLYYLYLNDNSTSNGSWNPARLTNGSSSINSVTTQSSDNSIVISGSPLSPPGGIIDFKLPTSISNLNILSTSGGFVVATGSNPLTWATRNLLGGGNIVVNNGDGVATDPIFVLSTSLTDLTSAEIGDLQISGNIITNNFVNGAIQLSSTGTEKVYINGIQIDTSGNITGANNLTLNGTLSVMGGFTNPTTPKGFFTFTDTLVPLSNVIAIKDKSSNISSITGSGGVYTINFSPAMSSTNYGVVFGLGSTGGSTPFVSHAFWTAKTVNSVSIVIVDASGVLVPDVEQGITGVIMSST
ncbi:hypothetical protein UFOVP51_75 [uncultured Caudovirales phage]|uniref:Uncharacterized protein n=1 Tax=uncultured Caudovirales phage TaxID=2100421 RepID=A0A6J5T8G4_9CAUD|nr:hypothetical protein UFOVP51_75 [uncultured Caudovirales phage]CAB4240847.1 hypothetical protein UFOVP34_31 [uncultured Caudovirales phage]